MLQTKDVYKNGRIGKLPVYYHERENTKRDLWHSGLHEGKMEEIIENYAKNEFKLSPIYEKELNPGGRGFIGFTILYGDDVFKNYVRFFTKESKAEILAQVKEKHLQYASSAQKISAIEKLER